MHHCLSRTLFCRFAFGLLFAIAVTGCGDGGDPEAAPTPLEVPTFTFYFPGQPHDDAAEVLDGLEDHIFASLPISLDFQWFGREYTNTVVSALASQADVDAFVVGEKNSYTFDYAELAREGTIADLGEILPETAPRLHAFYSDSVLRAVQVDGRLVAVPPLWPRFQRPCVYVRREIVDRYEIERVETYQDAERVLERMAAEEPGSAPAVIHFADITQFANAFGYVILDEQANLVYRWDDPAPTVVPWERTEAFKSIVGLAASWLESGYAASGGAVGNWSFYFGVGPHMEQTETTLSFSHSGGSEQTIEQIAVTCFIPYPDAQIQRDHPIGSIFARGATAFAADSPDIETGLRFLERVQIDERAYRYLHYGLEGVHYELVDGRGVKTDPAHRFYCAGFSVFRNAEQHGRDLEEIDATIAESTAVPPHLGFLPDYRDVAAELQARLEAYQRGVDYPMYRGTVDAAVVTGHMDRVARETDVVVGEVQRQLDRWLANQP